uniref:Uncharacterized protein n=1 Tax=Diaporthe helianthi tymovirus 1 TaxID=3077438 RepID=A0AA96HC33_9VIRU|nr:MAG: hypothetical protein [Diaporthe helianthi tymovirus 1]
MSSVTDLVNQAPATDAPRAIHCFVAAVNADLGEATLARVLHTNARVREVCAPFSRAHWLDCEVVFVPTPQLTTHVMHITAAFTGDDAAPTTASSLWQESTCTFHVSGESTKSPNIFVFPLSFPDACTSSLVKPAPIEMHRTALVFNIRFSSGDTGKPSRFDEKAVLVNVFLRGHLSLGGQA